ncbi:MAG: flagellar export chaperone FliS [Bryobacterales bacterium]|nr:flagellar export chaperone FliS [Bryobacterales bacterium]
MSIHASNAYLEGRVLAADRLELVCMLYEHALDSIGRARACLRSGDIAGRSGHITRAQAALLELQSSLDHQRGGPLSRNLLTLYEYLDAKLVEAHILQREEPLAEAARLLSSLLEGWRECCPDTGGVPETLPLAAAEPRSQEALSWAG